jgi:cell division protein ZapA
MNQPESARSVSIYILGKEYQIACPPEERQNLLRAAEHLDTQMRQIRDTGKVIGIERIAVMAAINLSHQLLKAESENVQISTGARDQLSRMDHKIQNALLRFSPADA